VKLRIAGAREAVPVGGRHEPLPQDPPHSIVAATREAGLALHVSERRFDRPLVRLEQCARDILVSDREQHADRLGRRECQVEPGHLRATPRWPKSLAGPRVATVHRAHEPGPVDLTAETDATAAAADPPARCLAATGEVVLETLGHLLLVVFELVDRRTELPDRQHGRRTPGNASLMQVVCPPPGGLEKGGGGATVQADPVGGPLSDG
jgi:hypothetical protein